MQELNDERVLFAFARDLEPALTVASGETVRIRTQDCFGNQVQTPEDELDEINWDRINPATGPVFVEGAVPGGALKVTIENIELDPQTASCTGKDEGVCGDRFDVWSTHLCAIDGDKLVWNDQLSIPLNPMIGVIGVAPAGDPVNCGTPGSHGGNMDNTAITTGAVLPRGGGGRAVRLRRHARGDGRWRDQRVGRRGGRLRYGHAYCAARPAPG